MDLQSMLKAKKSHLRPCKTILTNFGGRKFEIIAKTGESRELSPGLSFIVDTKPDLDIAAICPGLFLSSQDPTSSLEILREYKIHHILSLGVEPSVKFDDIEYTFLELFDLPESDICAILEKSIKIIDDCRKKAKNILVHCNAGVSRSASVVIGYLMRRQNLSFEDAFEKVKSARPCVRPNDGFVRQLKRMH